MQGMSQAGEDSSGWPASPSRPQNLPGVVPPPIFPSVCPSGKGWSGSLTKSTCRVPGSRPPLEPRTCPAHFRLCGSPSSTDPNPESREGLSDPLPPHPAPPDPMPRLSPAAPPQTQPCALAPVLHSRHPLCLCAPCPSPRAPSLPHSPISSSESIHLLPWFP